MSTALSATVGLGNIGGVADCDSRSAGPGAVFWIWIIGFLGMATKLTEVTLSMLYRNTSDPENPHGGPMYVLSRGVPLRFPRFSWAGKWIGGLFCITCLIMTATGGNMFQAWNAGTITQEYFEVPSIATGIVLAVIVGMVIIGGIKTYRRGHGPTRANHGHAVPAISRVRADHKLHRDPPRCSRSSLEVRFRRWTRVGAFIGGTMGYAFLFGMKRAIFSNEAGQGTSPIAHSAAKTREPVREGIVAGLEPFIDTIVVCTLTALVILSTGVWQRGAEAALIDEPRFSPGVEGGWQLDDTRVTERLPDPWVGGESVFVIVHSDANPASDNNMHRISGELIMTASESYVVRWDTLNTTNKPEVYDRGIYLSYAGATLTAKAFDTVVPGLGQWLVTLAVWLFAISTMIAYSYYGEQAMIFLAGERWVMPYKVVFCLLAVVATAGFLKTDVQLDNLSGLGTGVMLFVNVPVMWLFASQAMKAYKNYVQRLKDGRIGPGHAPPALEDVMSGKDVEEH